MDWLIFGLGDLSHFHLLRPWWLLVLVPLVWTIIHLWKVRSPLAKWEQAIAPNLIKAMRIRHGKAGRINPLMVFMVLAIIIVISLVGPSWKQQDSPFSEDLAAVIFVLDASLSMDNKDIQPSRLERAKQKVTDLLALRAGGRTALIVYAGSAHSVIPLTNDREVVNNFMTAITTKMMPRDGKFAEEALPIVDRMLQDSPIEGVEIKGTVVLITDGLAPDTDRAFSEYFTKNQHQLIVLGLSTNEADALEEFADNSQGYYQELTLDTTDVKRINRRIDSHMVIVEDGSRPWLDAGYYFLFPFTLLFLLWFRKGWTLNWTLVVIASVLYSPAQEVMAKEVVAEEPEASMQSVIADSFLSLWFTPDQLGQFYMWRGEYALAAGSFRSIAWRGVAYYRAENFKSAAETFSRIDTLEGHFNVANSWAHSRNYIKAVKSYNEVIKLWLADKNLDQDIYQSAIKNRDKVQKIIDEINLLSGSQKSESTDSSRDLADDQPQTAEGVERTDFNQGESEVLSAEDILLDDKINELWMRQVQKDPSRFLSIKFHMQLEQ